MKVIPSWMVWSMRQLSLSSFTFGLYLSVPLLCLFPFINANQLAPPVAGIFILLLYFGTFLIAVPVHALYRCRFHLGTFGRRVVAILWALVGLSIVHYGILLGAFLAGFTEIFSGRLPLTHAIIVTLWLSTSSLAYPIVRHWAPFKIQDGATCPGCGHCIRGVWSQICPECGRDFDHSNLGLSIAEFDERYGAGRPASDREGAG